ncbi:MAG: hypothetical protein ACTHK7_03085 [Aureliella sp.]
MKKVAADLLFLCVLRVTAVKLKHGMIHSKPSALPMSTHVMHAYDDRRPKSSQQPPPKHSILWIDGIGGYLLWDKPELVLGQAFAESRADVGIVGDLSRQAAVVRRLGTDYLLQPLQATKLAGQSIDRPQLLRDGAMIELGNSVKLRFRRPNALSGTARLEIASIHRWQPNVDAIVLLSDCCIMGARAGSHIDCSQWKNEVLLVSRNGQWQMRTGEEVLVNDQKQRGQFAVASGTRVRGEDFSLSFE